MKQANEHFASISRVVRRTRRLWRANEVLFGAFLLCAIFTALLIAGAEEGAGWRGRLWLLAPSGLAAAMILIRQVIFPLVRGISDDDTALLLEGKNPEFRERLISAVQLWREYDGGRGDFSGEMYGKLLEEAAGLARGSVVGAVLRWGRTAAAMAAAMVLAAVFFVVAQNSDGGFAGARGFVSPPYIPKREFYRMVKVTGDVRVARGGKAEIEAVFEGGMRGRPIVEIQRDALEPLMEKMRNKKSVEGKYIFTAKLKKVADDIEYRVKYRSFRSKLFKVTVVDPPSVKRISLRLTYPKHTGIMPESFSDGGDVRAPYGTKVSLEVEAARKLERAWLILNGRERLDMTRVADKKAKAEFTIKKSGGYGVHLVGALGIENAAPPVFSITSEPDEPPRIQILEPKAELRQARTEPVVVRAAAEDDYSVASVSLHYEVIGVGKRGDVKIPVKPARNMDFEYRWELSKAPAFEGDAVEFYLTAADNDALTGPKRAVSETRRVVLISEAEDYRNIEEIQDEILADLESVMREGTTVVEQFEGLRREIGKGDLGQKGQADLQRALRRQAEMEQELARISESLAGSVERMTLNNLIGPETIEKMRQLNEMMGQVMTEDMKDSLKNIQEAMKDMKLPALDKLMLEAVLDQEKINRSLDLTLKRLHRVKAEQGIQALAKQLDQLIKKQETVIQITKELQRKETAGLNDSDRREANRLAGDEDEISGRMGDIQSEMESLQAAFKAIDDDLALDLEGLDTKERTRRIRESLGEASGSLSEMKCGGAMQGEQTALEQMRSLSGGLKDFAGDYMDDTYAGAREELRRALDRTLNLSARHEKYVNEVDAVRKDSSQAGASEKAKALAEEGSFIQGVAEKLYRQLVNVAAATLAVSTDSLEDSLDVSTELRSMLASMEGGDFHGAFTLSREAYLGMNRLAIELLDAGERAGARGEQGRMEEYMRRLEEFANSQADLNEALKMLGSSGMPMPAMMESLQSMALQQALIREGMGELMRDMGNVGEIDKRLSQIEDEMEQIEKMLGEMDAGDEVKRRQAGVLRRLQDATLSMRKEFHDEKRMAERGKEYGASKPKPLIIRSGEGLPGEIRREMLHYRDAEYPEGYERPVRKYYEELGK